MENHPEDGFFDMPTIPDSDKKPNDFFNAPTLQNDPQFAPTLYEIPNAAQFARTRPVRHGFSAIEPTIEAYRQLNNQTVYLLGEKEPRTLLITRHRYLANIAYVRVEGRERTLIGHMEEGQKVDNPYNVKFSYWREVFVAERRGFK